MDKSIYILIAIGILLILGFLIIFIQKKGKKRSIGTLGALAFALIILGIAMSEKQIIAYSIMGLGIILAIIDIIIKSKKSEK